METAKYTNRFTVIANAQNSEFIVTFYQTMPELDENGKVTSAESVEIGKFVMNMKLAEEFAQTTAKLIDEQKAKQTDE